MVEQASALIPGLTNPALQRQSGSDALFDGIQHCALCGRVIEGRYAMVKAKIACVSCAARERDSATRMSTPVPAASRPSSAPVAAAVSGEESGSFARALLFGTGAAVVGLALYASFTIITHMYLGYVALAVGLMVGKAMMLGSGGVGGPRYQIAAVVLTYAAISLASIPILRGTQSRLRSQLGNDGRSSPGGRDHLAIPEVGAGRLRHHRTRDPLRGAARGVPAHQRETD
jgi:hypothetical protein